MEKSSTRNQFRIHLVTRSALIRLAVFFSILLILTLWAGAVMFWMPEHSYQGQFLPLNNAELSLKTSLQRDVKTLAVEIGSRNSGQSENLNRARNFLETAFAEIGYEVKRQEYQIAGQSYSNIEAEHKGIKKPDEIIIIGGHYDSAFSSPGANDNATGAAATLELARLFLNKPTNRTLRFVEFTNEEPPFFWTENMGSLVYAKRSHERHENIVAVLSLETMGYFSDTMGSQNYPFPINWFYPNTGNFISFIGNLNSEDLVKKTVASFRRHVQFPSEGASLPGWIPGVGWSDQWSFWQQGYKGIMVTDTAPYRYLYYHTEQDTPDKIDFDKLARIVLGLTAVISDLAESF